MEQYQKSGYRKTGRYQKKQPSEWLHVLLFYVLPFLVFNSILFFCVTTKPKITLAVADTKDYLSTEVTMTVKSWFPTKSVSMVMDGEQLTLTKGKKRTYTTTVFKNGSVEASVVNLNGMPAAQFEHVNVLDDNPPAFESTDILDGIATLTLSDSQSGINFDSIYAVNSQEQRIEPMTVDRASNTLSYEMDPAGLHVFAQDRAGNEVQGTFTSYKEGDTEHLEGGADENAEAANAEATNAAETNAAAGATTGTTGTTSGTTSGSTTSGTTSGSTAAGTTAPHTTQAATTASGGTEIIIN
ncbi:MAG: hypothetical protein PHV18_03925 [Lachnospiraceae bacterium]|nr:hypothetical protein [Lachnospiraceae bacterium]